MIDSKYRRYDFDAEVTENISFVDFIKLYINHRPAHGVTFEKLKSAFETICSYAREDDEDDDDNDKVATYTTISKSKFIDVLCSKGIFYFDFILDWFIETTLLF